MKTRVLEDSVLRTERLIDDLNDRKTHDVEPILGCSAKEVIERTN